MTRQETILAFIKNILTNRGTQDSEPIEHLFSNGYCYYFALILKDAFGGEIVWPKYYGHIVWYDTIDNVCYDAHGVNDAHCERDLVPIRVLTEGNLMAFKHTDERIELTPEDMYIQQGLVNEYEFSHGQPLSRYIDDEVQYFNIVKLSNDRTYAYDLRSSTIHMLAPSGFTDFIIDNNLDANKLSWIRRMTDHLEESQVISNKRIDKLQTRRECVTMKFSLNELEKISREASMYKVEGEFPVKFTEFGEWVMKYVWLSTKIIFKIKNDCYGGPAANKMEMELDSPGGHWLPTANTDGDFLVKFSDKNVVSCTASGGVSGMVFTCVLEEDQSTDTEPKRSISDIAKDPYITLKAVLLGIPMEEIESRLRNQFGDETALDNEEIVQAFNS